MMDAGVGVGGRGGEAAVDGVAVLRSLGETETAAQLFARCRRRQPALRLPFTHEPGRPLRRSVAMCTWIDVIVQHTYTRTALLALLLTDNLAKMASAGKAPSHPPPGTHADGDDPRAGSSARDTDTAIPQWQATCLVITTRGHLNPETIQEVHTRHTEETMALQDTASSSKTQHDQPQQQRQPSAGLLHRIHVIDCADLNQLLGAVEGLWAVLDTHPDIGLVVIEELDAFYWQMRSLHGIGGTQQLIAHLMQRMAAVQRDFGCGVVCGRTSDAQRFSKDDPRSHIITVPASSGPGSPQHRTAVSSSSWAGSSSSGTGGSSGRYTRQDSVAVAGLVVKSKAAGGRAHAVPVPHWLLTAAAPVIG